ncbi:30S ribosomal protein S19e [Vulcanisaeta souniana]|uniref:Small ribosomal subunit protein eS19 n=1 Tax=Vulcanisaeta souniana JCM 11219 TaxID=1293586 RepID=A0A830E9J9_9CREN|nr:30S ribosomal protein S19e [Vulcanisaeta souniana]BDR93499.1 30S ribosomal protein S19e [Vulcanisaeta souniana JCM 11219]GGI77599.1 30S ribosomal protein S19e [Vulcanisaeta souniana JCM 11219]
MVSVRDVPADLLIRELAKYLKENVPQVKPPDWALFVKTGPNKDRVPMQDDWWYIRAAAILRKVYLNGPVGLGSLRMAFSYRAKIGTGARSERTRKAGGAIIRNILHQLETAGLVTKVKTGRVVTPQGKSLLDKIAANIFKELTKKSPELTKYLTPKTATE